MKSRRFRVLALCALTLALSLTGFGAQLAGAAPTVVVGAPVNVSLATGNQAEPTIAVDPTNPLRIFVASNSGTQAAASTDGGATWSRYAISGTCCDNVAAFDDFGNLFLININSGASQVDLYLSTTGGTSGSFTLLQTLDTGAVDQPTVTVGANSVWATWNKGGTLYASGASVTALGTVGAFNSAQAIPGSNTVGGQFGDIAIGPSGQVTVTYQSQTNLYVNTDADGLGAGGFAAQVNVTSMNVIKFDFLPAQNGRSIDSEEGLQYDRSGGPFNGRLYMSYTDETPDESNDFEIMLRTSDDNGGTWSAATRVNDDATTRSQFLPHIALDQSTGIVAVTWHDARNDSGAGAGDTNGIANDDTQLWGSISEDGGATFVPNFQVSAGTSNAGAAGSSTDYGDYRWSAFVDGVLYPVWADNSNSTGDNPAGALSTFDVYMGHVSVTPSSVPPVVTVVVTPAPNANGWNNSDVFVDWTVTGADSTSGCDDVTLTAETSGTTLTCAATNTGGTTTVSTPVIKIDKFAPVITITTPVGGGSYDQAAHVAANYSCADALSGLATCVGTVANGADIDTATVGLHSFTVNATDNAGNSSSETLTYTVVGHMSVSGIAVIRRTCDDGSSFCFKWGVQVKSLGRGLPGADVSVTITKPNGATVNLTATTDRTGAAAFVVPADAHGTWTLSVANVTDPGYVYDAAHNAITTRSVGY